MSCICIYAYAYAGRCWSPWCLDQDVVWLLPQLVFLLICIRNSWLYRKVLSPDLWFTQNELVILRYNLSFGHEFVALSEGLHLFSLHI